MLFVLRCKFIKKNYNLLKNIFFLNMNSLLRSTFVLLILNIFFTNSLFAAITNLSSPLDTTTQNDTPTGIYFSNDGSKVFVLGSSDDGSDRDRARH